MPESVCPLQFGNAGAYFEACCSRMHQMVDAHVSRMLLELDTAGESGLLCMHGMPSGWRYGVKSEETKGRLPFPEVHVRTLAQWQQHQISRSACRPTSQMWC
eukprot:1136191-Pelagomonas_calceolata.AAC.2